MRDKCSAQEEELKKKQAEKEAEEQEEAALVAEEKDLLERQSQIKKKFTLYEKLIIKSPERLNKEVDKNQARIDEIKKLSTLVSGEIDQEKRSLFERTKFIESSQSIKEILVNHFNHVQSANSKQTEIDRVKEEITNLNFVFAQTESSIESLTKSFENLNSNIDSCSKESHAKLVQYHDKIERTTRQINEIKNRFRKFEEDGVMIQTKINETKNQSNEFINNAMGKIQMFHKNEGFSKSITMAKLKSISSYNELSNQKVGDALKKMKKSLEMFKRLDREAREL